VSAGRLQAIYPYEDLLLLKNIRKAKARRTWQMISRYATIGSIARAVGLLDETSGRARLTELGYEDLAFEAARMRHRQGAHEKETACSLNVRSGSKADGRASAKT